MLVKCSNCYKEFNKLPNQIKRSKTGFHYCSRSCAVTTNNSLFPKRIINPLRICECGNRKDIKAELCVKCVNFNHIKRANSYSLEECISKYAGSLKYIKVRTYAKKKFYHLQIPKICKLCGFDRIVELCHIKPISSFSNETLLSEINSLQNLVYLCPNHHSLLDKDLLTQEEINVVLHVGTEPTSVDFQSTANPSQLL